MTQPTLFKPSVTGADVATLCGWLRQRNTWTTRVVISQALGWSERKVRAISEAAGCLILGGQKGYRLAELATADECAHVGHWMIAQGDKMRAKGQKCLALAHKKLHTRVAA